jgi:hypothetical protein
MNEAIGPCNAEEHRKTCTGSEDEEIPIAGDEDRSRFAEGQWLYGNPKHPSRCDFVDLGRRPRNDFPTAWTRFLFENMETKSGLKGKEGCVGRQE